MKPIVALALAAPVLVCPRLAQAENGGPLFYSDDAALLSGAAIALPADPASVHYNPAGLGALKRARVSVNGSLFGVRIRSINGALVTEADGQRSSLDLDSIDFVSTPTGITAAFSLHPAVTLGLGFYTTERDIQSAVDDDTMTLPSLDAIATQRIDLQLDTTKYQAGAALGFALSDSVRLGVGVFGIYATQDAYVQFTVDVDDAQGRAGFESVTARLATTAWGILPTAGFQWDVTPAVHLALVAKAPEIMLAASADSAGTAAVGSTFVDPPVVALEVYEAQSDTDKVEMLAPARFALGASFDPTPMVRVALEAEVSLPVDNQELGVRHEVVANGRLGVRYQVAPGLVLGSGLFTDLASAPLGESLGSRRVHYFGTTLGGTLLTPLSVGGSSDPDAIILTTTLAVRYAVGIGEARTTTYDGGVSYGTTDVVFHDVTPYTGSAILF